MTEALFVTFICLELGVTFHVYVWNFFGGPAANVMQIHSLLLNLYDVQTPISSCIYKEESGTGETVRDFNLFRPSHRLNVSDSFPLFLFQSSISKQMISWQGSTGQWHSGYGNFTGWDW